VISGSALLVDYVLTITVSIAAAGDALFSFAPVSWQAWKRAFEIVSILALTTLNIRGVKESVLVLAPIFVAFVITHVLLIVVGIGRHVPEIPATAVHLSEGFHHGWSTLGAGGLLLLFAHAYSLGGGTYTGIEAVSNGLQIMRDPKVPTARSSPRARCWWSRRRPASSTARGCSRTWRWTRGCHGGSPRCPSASPPRTASC
jgi:amino acid transporter